MTTGGACLAVSFATSHLEMESKCGRESGIDEILAAPTLPWLISVPAMIDDSNIPRFKQRLEIRYDHRPALRHGSDELGVRPFRCAQSTGAPHGVFGCAENPVWAPAGRRETAASCRG
jgi:hypothetical protein